MDVGKLLKIFNGSKETKCGQVTRKWRVQITPVVVRAVEQLAPLDHAANLGVG